MRRSEAQQATVGRKSRILLAWGLTLAGVCLVGASLALAAVGLPIPVYPGLTALSVIATPLLILGGLICARNPQVRLGRILLGLGVVGSVQLVCGEYATYSVLGHAGQLFATGATAWLSSIAQVVLVVGLIVIILLFPTGRVLSRRWRPVAWALGVGFIGVLAATAFGGPTFNSNLDFVRNPLYVAHPPPTLNALVSILTVALVVGLIGSIAQLIVRLRGSKGDERQQLKWFAYAGIMAPLVIVAVTGPLSNVAPVLGNIVWTLGPLSLVAAVGIGVLKYRLYDIDVVINKTVVFGALAAFITAVYVAIVVGIGAAIGHDSRPNLGLSLLATGVVAVAFQPIREREQHFANHLVYGRRATPYEVLSEFSSRMAGSYESEDVLPRMSRILGEGTGAGSTRVWLKVGDELRAEAMWPDSEEPPAIPMEDEVLPPVPDASLVLPVRHRGDLLGALSLTKRPGERLTPTETKLASDLASGAGLVLRNVRLTEELLARVEELRASRQRLVAAQDDERRRIERNIHDGAQQQLVALAVKQRLVASLVEKDAAKALQVLDALQEETTEALENLRDLARGIYPPLLADKGLVVALDSQARKSPLPVSIESDGIERYPREIEAAVYFCCLEALQNVAKYAEARRATVRLQEDGDGALTFEVTDDGRGFDPALIGYGTGLQGMEDRLDALGGSLEVRSAPTQGTTVLGRVRGGQTTNR